MAGSAFSPEGQVAAGPPTAAGRRGELRHCGGLKV
jgi:hypothetical protein